MTTLAVMKARIADETDRDDLLETISGVGNSSIGLEIISAIEFYRPQRFYFNEKRSTVLFNTVIGQDTYTSAADANIPHLIRIDSVTVTENGSVYPVRLASPEEIELWIGGNGALQGGPRRFSYYAQELRFYPIPNAVVPVRIMGVMRVAAPATDDEAGNPWMTDAEELIRARAKRNLYLNKMGGTDRETIAVMQSLESEKLDALKRETSSRAQVSRLKSSCL